MILLFILSGAVCLCKHISIQLIPPNSWKPDQMNKGVKFETYFMVAIMYLNLESTKANADQSLMNCSYLVLSPGSWSEGMGWMNQKQSERKTRVTFELIITVGTWGLFPLRPVRNWEGRNEAQNCSSAGWEGGASALWSSSQLSHPDLGALGPHLSRLHLKLRLTENPAAEKLRAAGGRKPNASAGMA